MNVLKLCKGAIAMFIIGGALLACKKESSEPAATKKNVNAQSSRIVVGETLRTRDYLFVKVAKEIYFDSFGYMASALIYLKCNLNTVGNQETIKSIDVIKHVEGDLLSGAAATVKIRGSDRAYAQVAFITATSSFFRGSYTVDFHYDQTRISYRFYTISGPNLDPSGPYYIDKLRNLMALTSFKPRTCSFFRDAKGKIQFRWGN